MAALELSPERLKPFSCKCRGLDSITLTELVAVVNRQQLPTRQHHHVARTVNNWPVQMGRNRTSPRQAEENNRNQTNCRPEMASEAP